MNFEIIQKEMMPSAQVGHVNSVMPGMALTLSFCGFSVVLESYFDRIQANVCNGGKSNTASDFQRDFNQIDVTEAENYTDGVLNYIIFLNNKS